MDKNNTYTCTFTGLTRDQAKVFASWYSGQGEQDADFWFAEWCPDRAPIAGKIEEDESGNVKVHCR